MLLFNLCVSSALCFVCAKPRQYQSHKSNIDVIKQNLKTRKISVPSIENKLAVLQDKFRNVDTRSLDKTGSHNEKLCIWMCGKL